MIQLFTVVVDTLRKSYGDVKAVDGISFSVEDGEIFSLLGPNGAGKTTTMEILEGLRAKDDGEVLVLGLDPWKAGYELHRKMGIIPQGFRFFDYATPREAIRYYAKLFGVKADVDHILKEVILEDAASLYYNKLSGGQKQKLGLALSLVNNPQLVVLDEPTTGLDPQARRAVWNVIRELKKEDRSVLLTTHYLEEAEILADRVAIMNHGKIISAGTTEEILEKEGSGERLEVKASESLADYLKKETKLKVEYRNGTVSILLERPHDAMIALSEVEQSGIEWKSLRTREDTLEDIFVKIVGGSTTEAGEVV
jgi:ABC-2 type transport system ATP-binding protein